MCRPAAGGCCPGCHRSAGRSRCAPYAGERWWVFALFAGLTAVLIGLAYTLVGRRDVGAGLIADRPGAPRASRALQTSLATGRAAAAGHVDRLGRGFVRARPVPRQRRQERRRPAQDEQPDERLHRAHRWADRARPMRTSSATIGLFALAVAAYGITAVLRARTEETDGRAENLLATRVTRAAVPARPRAGGTRRLGSAAGRDGSRSRHRLSAS